MRMQLALNPVLIREWKKHDENGQWTEITCKRGNKSNSNQ